MFENRKKDSDEVRLALELVGLYEECPVQNLVVDRLQ